MQQVFGVFQKEKRERLIYSNSAFLHCFSFTSTCILIRFLDSLGVSATSFVLSTKQSAEEDSLFYFFSNLESFDKRVYNLFSAADFT